MTMHHGRIIERQYVLRPCNLVPVGRAAKSCGREGNRRSAVALAVRRGAAGNFCSDDLKYTRVLFTATRAVNHQIGDLRYLSTFSSDLVRISRVILVGSEGVLSPEPPWPATPLARRHRLSTHGLKACVHPILALFMECGIPCLFTARGYAKCGICRRRVSVRLSMCVSATFRYCINTAKRRITQIMPHDRVFK